MGNKSRKWRDTFKKRGIKKQQQRRTIPPWADLPRDILGNIIGKLPSTVDVIRIRAVCKNWQIPTDRIDRFNGHYRLPWPCCLSRDRDQGPRVLVLKCKMFIPNSHELIETRKSMQEFVNSRYYFRDFDVYGSKEGWLIADSLRYGPASMDFCPLERLSFMYNPCGTEIIPLPSLNTKYTPCFPSKGFCPLERLFFMYNPYSTEIISLPSLDTKYTPSFATFSCNPDSPDCQVYVLLCSKYKYDYKIAICHLNVDNKWTIDNKFIQTGIECRGMQYMNGHLGHLLFLFDDAMLRKYSVADGTWTRLNRRKRVKICHFPNHSKEKLWLVRGERDILVACKINLVDRVCSSFYFDWSDMDWVDWVENDLSESTAIFISGRTGMVRPFLAHDDRADTKGCRVFFFDYRCYNFLRGRMTEFVEYRDFRNFFYDTQAIMEPPRIR